MRNAGCSIQQSLTPETATIVKQAITLARRRGHSQVTPIHVASVMLASPAGHLRAACLKSHSYPFQCKALELCFNVALNRLPTTTLTPILGPQAHYPSLANALMAAFKRAQAHQRRGSIESQQQPILALKIESEQLVISILNDPSVSRVMREAGFSSTHVKSYVEQVVASLESGSHTTTTTNNKTIMPNTPLNHLDLVFSKPFVEARSEDVSSVIDSWVRKREKSSVVLVGECLVSCEGVVRGVKEKSERGDVPLELKYMQFLNCPLLSMKNLSKEEIDLKLGEIRCLLKGCMGRGVVLYLGDLRWVAEYWAHYGEQRRHYYCPVEHLIMGLRRLVFGNVENGRIWLMGIATFNTLIKCKSGNPPLETLLDLHSLTIPSGSLDLSLNFDSSLQSRNKSSISGGIERQLTCCTDCSANCRRESRSLAGRNHNKESITITITSTSSSLPSWLQKCKEESRELSTSDQEETVQMKELCKKWNLICRTAHKTTSNYREKTINFSSISCPSSSTSISSYETKPNWPIIFEHQFPITNDHKPELLSNPNSTPNSASSSEATEAILLQENNPDNFSILCCALEQKVPWQKEIIPEIASTILRCRSKKEKHNRTKQETCLFFLGVDEDGKKKIARELAKLMFGSETSFVSISLRREDSREDLKNRSKRGRDDEISGRSYLERFAKEVRQNPHRVFYMEDVEQLDECSKRDVRRAIERGEVKVDEGDGDEVVQVQVEDAIVIFSCENFNSVSRACSPSIRRKVVVEDLDEATSSFPLDLNIPADDVRILESVDKHIFFHIHVL